MGTKSTIKVGGVLFDVDYTISGHGDDIELDEVLIFIGEQEVTDVLREKTLREIDEKIMAEFWNSNDGPDCDYREDR